MSPVRLVTGGVGINLNNISRGLGATCCMVVVVLWAELALPAAPKRVLILQSFGPEGAPFNVVAESLRATLCRELQQPVDYEEVSLENARFPDGEVKEGFHQFLRQRFFKGRFDLVIPIGSPAMQFAVQHRAQLFPNTPVLFTASELRRIPGAAARTNATFVTGKLDLPGMIEDILRLRPQTTNIVLVTGASTTDKFWAQQCRKEWEKYTNLVGFTFLEGLSLRDTCKRAGHLPPGSFVVFTMMLRDGDGVLWANNEALSSVCRAANAPVCAMFESEFRYGTVGGRMYPDRELGVVAGNMAARILLGEPVEAIGPEIVTSNKEVFDWRELRRWNIPASRLPPGSRVENQELSFWHQYSSWVLGALALCTLETTLIAGLMIHRARLRRCRATSALIADLSLQFINLHPKEVDSAIQRAQKLICENLDLDLCFLWQWNPGTPTDLQMTHEYRRGAGPATPEQMRHAIYFPWSLQQLKKRQIVSIGQLKSAPAEAQRDVQAWHYFGVRAALKIPLYGPDLKVFGALGFHSTRKERVWRPSVVNSLKILTQVFANALLRKKTEQQLRESEERLALAAEAAGAGLWSIQLNTGEWWMTRQAQELFDLGEVERVTFELFLNSIHPADQARVRKAVEEVMRSALGSSVDFRVIFRDGTVRWIRSQGQVHCSGAGQAESLMGVFIDITEQMQSVEALRGSEQDYRLLFENMRSGVVILEVICNSAGKPCDHRLLHANREWERQTGLTEKNEKGKTSAELSLKWPAELAQCYYQVAMTGEPFRGELVDEARNHYFDLRVFCPRKGQFAVMTHDMTEQRRAEVEARELRRALAHSGRVNLLGQLASALAHELSQPVGAILRNAEAAQLMLSDPDVDVSELRAILSDIIRDDMRAGNVIDRLRSLLKRRPLDLEEVKLPELLSEVLSLVQPDAAARNVKLAYFISCEVPPVRGDRIHLQQVLLNLIMNALDSIGEANPGTGLIQVRATVVDPGLVEVRVLDNGPGLGRVGPEKLFEPFYTTKLNGMGMGLPISKTIIEAHQGRMWAENRPDGGACFGFTLHVSEIHNRTRENNDERTITRFAEPQPVRI